MPAAAIAGAAVIGAGTSIIAGNKAAKAQKNAANTAAASQDRASEVQRYIYDTTRADFTPNRLIGQSALGKLADMYGVSRPTDMYGAPAQGGLTAAFGAQSWKNPGDDRFLGTAYTAQPYATTGGQAGMTPGYEGFQASPGYQFRVGEAMKAIERSAAARGSLRSGATMDAIQRRVQGVASDEYENYANRLAALAGIGQNAQNSTAQAGQNYASGQASIANNQGQLALAAGNARASGYANTGAAINQGVQNLTGAYLYGQGWGR